MKNFDAWKEAAPQYKANLHAHSTNSDGRLSPEAMIEAYKKEDYKILAFTEHEVYTNTREYDSDDFLILPGIERSIQLNQEEYHINGIGDPDSDRLLEHGAFIEVPQFHELSDVQKIIDELKEADNFVTINHPYWSCNKIQDLIALRNYDALEVFNFSSEVGIGNGDSETYVDQLLWANQPKFVLATDDNHNLHRYQAGITMRDSFGGWINIVSDEFSKRAMVQALKKGSFYASSGPKVMNYGLRDGKLYVECSPCTKVIFRTFPRRGYTIYGEHSSLEKAEYVLRGGEKCFRIVCVDEAGRKAWTNISMIEE